MQLFDCYAVSDSNARAIPAHLSQSGNWVCNVNDVEIDLLVYVGYTWGKPVFAGLQITKDKTACPSVTSDQHHC